MTVIKVENLSKKYLIRHQQQERYTALRDVIANKFKSFGAKIFSPFTFHRSQSSNSPFTASEEFFALKDVSFEIKQGDRVGIIGRNGAGKTTLLKLLSRITEPTSGRIEITGRVASLLEVGTGFHPELTGRENIFLNGAILGMSKAEIKKKFDEIVDFAEIEKFLDTPVKRYSSGMYVRLAFAVAAHLEPEILVVDEVLAVGDAAFQKKCLGKMEEVGKEGRTVLFVSHNIPAIQNLCTHAMLIQQGNLNYVGKSQEVIEKYHETYLASRVLGNKEFIHDNNVRLQLYLCDNNGILIDNIVIGQSIEIILNLVSKKKISNLNIGLGIEDRSGNRIVTFHTRYQCSATISVEADASATARINWDEVFLTEGRYKLVVAINDGEEIVSFFNDVKFIDIIPSDYFGTGKLPYELQGRVLAKAKWSFEKRNIHL